MYTGIVYVLGACICWGLVFAIPPFIEGFSSFEIAMGRCFFFGFFSLIIAVIKKKISVLKLSKKIWQAGALWALIGFLIHYFALVLSLRYVNPTIPTLILGATPVEIKKLLLTYSKEIGQQERVVNLFSSLSISRLMLMHVLRR